MRIIINLAGHEGILLKQGSVYLVERCVKTLLCVPPLQAKVML